MSDLHPSPFAPTDVLARRLMGRAHGGRYAAWIVASGPGGRLGAARLRTAMPQAVLDRIAVEVGGPGYIVHSSRTRVPLLYVRARARDDFRQLVHTLRGLAGAMGLTLSIFDTTEPAAAALAPTGHVVVACRCGGLRSGPQGPHTRPAADLLHCFECGRAITPADVRTRHEEVLR